MALYICNSLVIEQPSYLGANTNVNELGGHVHVANVAALMAFHVFRLFHSIPFIDPNLGFWELKPRSNMWFSQFVLHEYDDDRWISLFRMTKASILTLS